MDCPDNDSIPVFKWSGSGDPFAIYRILYALGYGGMIQSKA